MIPVAQMEKPGAEATSQQLPGSEGTEAGGHPASRCQPLPGQLPASLSLICLYQTGSAFSHQDFHENQVVGREMKGSLVLISLARVWFIH